MNAQAWKLHRENVTRRLRAESDAPFVALFFAGDAVHRSEDDNYDFSVNRNFYYLTGVNRDKCVFLIDAREDPAKETLFIEEVSELQAKWTGPGLDIDETRQQSGIEDIRGLAQLDALLTKLLGTCPRLYLDLPFISWQGGSTAHAEAERIRKALPHVLLLNAYPALCQARLHKDNDELDAMRTAISITHDGLKSMWENGKPGEKEYQWEAWYNLGLNRHGSVPSFTTIAGSGPRGTILHYRANTETTQDGELLLCDLGARSELYCSDITRTFPVNGRFTARQRELYNVVLRAHDEIIAAMGPGKPSGVMQETAKRVLFEGAKAAGLVKVFSDLDRYYYHGAGHPLGLDVHDVGGRDFVLEPRMVMTVEPGLYIAEEGIGIRIEDDVLITETGTEILSRAIPITVQEIEAVMSK